MTFRALGLVILMAAGGAPSAAGEEFRFSKLDRTYADFVQELAPLRMGPVEVRLSSPEHSLTVRRHRALLDHLGDGVHRILLEVELEGRGILDAELAVSGVEGRLRDELSLPVQTLSLWGKVRLHRENGDYLITLVEAPDLVEVEIESQLAGRIVPLCKQMALVLVRFDCEALEDALSVVRVPLPGPGQVFILPGEELHPAEAEELTRYIEAYPPP